MSRHRSRSRQGQEPPPTPNAPVVQEYDDYSQPSQKISRVSPLQRRTELSQPNEYYLSPRSPAFQGRSPEIGQLSVNQHGMPSNPLDLRSRSRSRSRSPNPPSPMPSTTPIDTHRASDYQGSKRKKSLVELKQAFMSVRPVESSDSDNSANQKAPSPQPQSRARQTKDAVPRAQNQTALESTAARKKRPSKSAQSSHDAGNDNTSSTRYKQQDARFDTHPRTHHKTHTDSTEPQLHSFDDRSIYPAYRRSSVLDPAAKSTPPYAAMMLPKNIQASTPSPTERGRYETFPLPAKVNIIGPIAAAEDVTVNHENNSSIPTSHKLPKSNIEGRKLDRRDETVPRHRSRPSTAPSTPSSALPSKKNSRRHDIDVLPDVRRSPPPVPAPPPSPVHARRNKSGDHGPPRNPPAAPSSPFAQSQNPSDILSGLKLPKEYGAASTTNSPASRKTRSPAGRRGSIVSPRSHFLHLGQNSSAY